MSDEPKRCKKCGEPLAEGQRVCANCGEPARPDASFQEFPAQQARATIAYAGFWLRLLAYALDVLLLSLVISPIIIAPMVERGIISLDNPLVFAEPSSSRQILAAKLFISLIAWLYFASCESSAWQATLGKKIIGLRVTDLAGRRISFLRASGRYFGKILSGMILLLGFVMAGFTEKKQALHDFLAGCLVLRRKNRN